MQPIKTKYDYPLTADSVSTARNDTRTFCRVHELGHVETAAVAITSELIGNSIKHVPHKTGVPFECSLILTIEGGGLEVAVWDFHPMPCPQLRRVGEISLDAEGAGAWRWSERRMG